MKHTVDIDIFPVNHENDNIDVTITSTRFTLFIYLL